MKAGWEVKRLGDICRLELGSTPQRKNPLFWDSDRATTNVWLSIADMTAIKGKCIGDSKEYVSDLATGKMKLVPEGTLVLSFKLSLGRVAITSRDLRTNEAIVAIHDLDARQINREYLFWYFSFYDWDAAAANDEKLKGKTLNKAKLKVQPVIIPPFEEQKRIVAVLDAAFEGLTRAKENAETNLQNARELFERRLASAFKKIEAEENTKPITVAEIALPQKGSIRTGPFGSQLLHSEFTQEGIAVLGIDNAVKNEFRWGKSRFISPEKYEALKRYTVKPGDVIITIMGTCGRCAVVPDDIPVAINTKHLCCISLDHAKCIPEYLHAYFLHSEASLTYLNANASGSVMDGLNMGLIKELPVFLPDIATQRTVAALFQEAREKTLSLEGIYQAKLQDIADLRQSLLQKAFAGELT
ncbi:restriction endonuclease subunit S [uncultured Shimia sp.]|uniref:restriction endonuclease subunit S n=1 Tax=uncultured Shimia sp. TaxID=573152 RepID=UPI0025EC38D1|nr:restriction endonuclease subunit S [uncultured Shimia sp.]